jgi:hypothetical protein
VIDGSSVEPVAVLSEIATLLACSNNTRNICYTLCVLPLAITYRIVLRAHFGSGIASPQLEVSATTAAAELSITGQRARSNNYQLDGQNNNDNTYRRATDLLWESGHNCGAAGGTEL